MFEYNTKTINDQMQMIKLMSRVLPARPFTLVPVKTCSFLLNMVSVVNMIDLWVIASPMEAVH
jgi:hypothetical protein